MADPHQDELREIYAQCTIDRVFFVENLFTIGYEPDGTAIRPDLDLWQRALLEDLDTGDTRISVRSGHGVGKTCECAWLAIHFLFFRRGVKIVVTSPSGSQMRDGLIPEVKLWVSRLPVFMQEQLDIKSDRISHKRDPDNNFISFRTARLETPEALAGIHAENVMIIVDEASGVPEPIYEAAAGTLSTAGAIAVLIGNPTRAKGLFYRTHTSLSDLWNSRRVSCLDSPRVDAAFVEDIRRTYGVDSNQYRVRVLGQFPTSDADSVITRELAEPALTRDVDLVPDSQRIWGVDPGRGGDPTGFCDRIGNVVEGLEEWHDADLMKIVGRIKSRWDDCSPSDRPSRIYVDSIGLGAGVADRLRELELPCVDVNVSESPAMKNRFPRLRAELWFDARGWFDARNSRIMPLKYAEELVEELVTPEMILLSNGKTDVESKPDLKRRGVPSPNLADAFCLTMAEGGGAIAAGRGSGSHWSTPISRGLSGIA